MTHHEFVLPTRKAHRLPNYDYSHTGAYFVTICTRGRWCLFGDVRDEEMHLNRYGSIVADEWFRTAQLRRNVEFGAFVVMPNHVHGVIMLNMSDNLSARDCGETSEDMNAGRGSASPSSTIGAVVRGFKAATTRRINEISPASVGAVWQRNYYEHVIRTEEDLERIHDYITGNPARWDEDDEHPDRRSRSSRNYPD